MGGRPAFVRGRGWTIWASVVGVLALFVAAWAAAVLDTGGTVSLAVAICFVGVATFVLIPPTSSQRRVRPTRAHRRR